MIINERVCGNCRYWGGERNNINIAEKKLSKIGLCWGPCGSFKNSEVKAHATCIKWSKFFGMVQIK